jgi:tRNA A37 methylthiotransferase MiaB
MTAAAVIEEIKHLAPKGQAEVIQFAVELARSRQLTAQELGELADRLAESNDPAEIIRLKSAMTRGFYGQ